MAVWSFDGTKGTVKVEGGYAEKGSDKHTVAFIRKQSIAGTMKDDPMHREEGVWLFAL